MTEQEEGNSIFKIQKPQASRRSTFFPQIFLTLRKSKKSDNDCTKSDFFFDFYHFKLFYYEDNFR